jgi:hypothetical protein
MTRIRLHLKELGRGLLYAPLVLLTIVLLPVLLLLYGLYLLALNALIRTLWLPRGKDVLLVYSDSPIWQDYMTREILPLVKHRAKVLNWSERKRWPRWSLPVRVFHIYSGSRDFNPIVIVFPPFEKAVLFRFFPAFQEFKHGKPDPLERMREDLIAHLQRSGSSKGQGAGML